MFDNGKLAVTKRSKAGCICCENRRFIVRHVNFDLFHCGNVRLSLRSSGIYMCSRGNIDFTSVCL